jgi:hypothetical protein|tara:strand:- start:235 stop:411 length:177 start_codon:yes stop_codon:yes gene_type:complete
MENKELIDKMKRLKEDHSYTLHDLSKMLDIQIATIERWFKTERINRLYAQKVKEVLEI